MIVEDIFWGLRRSMVVAAGFAAIVSGEYLVLGPGTTARIGLTLPVMLLMYVGAGLLAGIVLGIGRPLGKTHVGAIVLGIFVATCVYGSAGIAIDGLPNRWHAKQWFSAIAAGVVIGAFAGDKFFNDYS